MTRSLAEAALEEQGSASWRIDAPENDALGAGAEPCLATLYRNESPRLVRLLSRRTSDREEAQDLVQEIFARVARLGLSGLRALERPEAYLSMIARNLLKDRAKRAGRRSLHLHVVADENEISGVDQERLLESRDMLNKLEAALLRLKPRTREIFMAHRLDGLSYAEIAERTGLSIKSVEKQMSKAIAHIDRLLDRS